MKSELILVTGGAGFIGSHLCQALLEDGYRVRVLDDFSTGKLENVPPECEFIQGSILDESLVDKALKGVHHVSHQAAIVSVRGSVERFAEDAQTNLMGSLLVLKAAARHDIRKFVYASSMAVYADTPAPLPISEQHPTAPISPYGIAKFASEQYVMLLGPILGLQPTVLRYFNTFGPRQGFTPYVGVITIFVTRLLQRKAITIYGDGQQCRDFVHVSDIVNANLLALKNPDASGKILNIGSGHGTTVNDLARTLTHELDPNAVIHYEPARPEELRNSIADISQARQILGYSPKTKLSDQVREVIRYLR
jgi:UDP-glucose 4-epimerase